MAVVQGAMIGGYLIPEDQFKQILKDFLQNQQNKKNIQNIINTAIRNAENKEIKRLYNNIEKLENEILKNPATQLMTIIFEKKEDEFIGAKEWYLRKREKTAITNAGNISKIKAMTQRLRSQEIRDLLSNHLNNMIKNVQTETIDNIDEFFNKYNFSEEKKSKIGKNASHSHYSLQKIIYGDNKQYLGQIADAFLNHLGNFHRGVLFSNYDLTDNDIANLKKSVKEEENDNYYQLLINSTNNTGWWTGGDLIILDNDGKVLASIQLKTTSESSSWSHDISYKQIGNDLKILKRNLLENEDEFINKFYQDFKTSGVAQDIIDTGIQEGEEAIEDTLDKIRKNLKI